MSIERASATSGTSKLKNASPVVNIRDPIILPLSIRARSAKAGTVMVLGLK
jgi:hypothetical protein